MSPVFARRDGELAEDSRPVRSEEATRHRYAIRGFVSTAAKHGISVLAALRSAIAGDPWMPPIPAQA